MADEGQTITQNEQKEDKNPLDSRLKDLLSDKTKLSEEVKAKEDRIKELERENAFNSGFVDVLGAYPMAKDHKDEIKAKVLSGYTAEDAALAVLGKAGKLAAPPVATPQNPAGGSASTVPQTGQKTPQQMSQSERRDILAGAVGWD